MNSQIQKTRVLHVVGRMHFGGVENWLMSLLRKADHTLLTIDFCVAKLQKGCYDDEIIALGGKILPCTLQPILLYQHRLSRLLKENRYDVVHSHGWLFSGLVLQAAHKCGVPVRIAHSHNTKGQHASSLYRTIYAAYMRYLIKKHATHFIGCSTQAAAALFGSDWQQCATAKVVYCSINVECFRPEQKIDVNKSSFGIPYNGVVIGHIGSFRKQKNHTFFIDIAAEIVKREPRAYFFFAGDGPLRGEIEEKAKRLGLYDHMIFGGNRQDVPELLMNVYDILLFPSLYEGMPLTLVEAAAAGLRAVCSDTITPEATDVIPDAFTRLSLNSSVATWADKVLEIVKKGRLNHDLSYKIVSNSHFSVNYSLDELLKIYTSSKEK